MSLLTMRTPPAVLLCLGPLSVLLGAHAADDGRARVEVVAAEGMTEWDRFNLERNLRWILARERAARAGEEPQPARPRVGVFADAGVWHPGARSIVDALEEKGIACRAMDRSTFRGEELARFDAIVLPGGWAPFQWAALGEPGLAALRAYVEGGGRCLGICAGAYLLSRTTQYDSEVYPYPLGLFDGTARGPIEGLARFPQAGRARLSVTAEGRRRGLAALSGEPLYYSGGPCFLGGTGVEVLARYHDGNPAAIGRKVGKGEVILIGVHPERPPPERGDDEAPPPAAAGELLRALLSAAR
jgi:glutamine amidotransferase-like uncharacterized protein